MEKAAKNANRKAEFENRAKNRPAAPPANPEEVEERINRARQFYGPRDWRARFPKSPTSGDELKRILEENGWVHTRTKGEHMIMESLESSISVPVPRHKQLATGTYNAIIRLTQPEF